MYRLGLRLTMRSGREAAVRLLLTMLAVAVGVTVLLAVLADYHAFEVTSRRPSWESTTGLAAIPASVTGGELWNYSESIYKGRFIETLDVAALGPGAPVIPGIPSLPSAGHYYASPALASLLRTVPADELGDRFPGAEAGTIGQPALSGPAELAIVVGYPPAALEALPGTRYVTRIATAPQIQGTTNIYRLGFGVGAILLLFPLLILVNTATRLATARREERFAAMRLVGATPHQINVIASVDAVAGSFLGALVGTGAFLLLRPAIAGVSLSGARFFTSYVTPTAWGYALMIAGVPVASAGASLWSLRRVRLTPLGVSRKATPRPPRAWRLIPLAAGLALFAYVTTVSVTSTRTPTLVPVFLDLILIMVGLVVAGSWLTMQAARLLARAARGGSALLAARHLADNPKAAFRAVSGLVIAVFVGTAIAGLAPADIAAQSSGRYAALDNVLRVNENNDKGPASGLSPAQGAALISRLESFPGVSVIPLYVNPAFASSAPPIAPGAAGVKGAGGGGPAGGAVAGGGPAGPVGNLTGDTVIACASLQRLSALGTCPAGAAAVQVNARQVLFTDNPLIINEGLPLVTPHNPRAPGGTANLEVGALLVKAADADSIEKARTYLTTYNATIDDAGGLSAYQMGSIEPETFGEVAALRNNDDNNLNRVVLLGTALTILVAGCSLAVSVGGSLIDRKRPFCLLRVSGTPTSALYRAVFLESGLPLITAAVVAAGAGLAVVVPLVNAIYAKVGRAGGAHGASPGGIYYVAMGAGLGLSMGVIMLTLPLLGRMTQPRNARFE